VLGFSESSNTALARDKWTQIVSTLTVYSGSVGPPAEVHALGCKEAVRYLHRKH